MIQDLHPKIDKTNLPQHIAIIMDGNGRWAKTQGKLRVFGHSNAITAVRESIEGAAEIGVKYLTLYAFSTENWNRPKDEVSSLMTLLFATIGNEIKGMHKNNIRLNVIGNINQLPQKVQKELNAAMELTKNNTHLTLTLALSYSARWEITEAAKKIALLVKEDKIGINNITENLFASQLTTQNMPDPELLIRTSGEVRISNFLLWQLSYAELFFTDVLWPDFRKANLVQAINYYQTRERRFGKTSEQLNNK